MNDKDSYFHEAEINIQKRVNSYEHIAKVAPRMLHNAMPTQHSDFYENIPFVIVGMLDALGRPWAMPISGPHGFIKALDSNNLQINQLPVMHTTLGIDIKDKQKIGLLGIDLSNRRRNRMNGHLKQTHDSGFTIGVEQSFGNCPKYIQLRDIQWEHKLATPQHINRSTTLDSSAARIVDKADTFFIASRTADINETAHNGIDASHRGGHPGFVNITSDTTLIFPDFSGNRLFNTLGNIESDGRVGLFFPDYTTGNGVFITGNATIIWDPQKASAYAGAERLLEIHIEEVVYVEAALSTTGKLIETSPFLTQTGPWEEPAS